MKKLIKKLKKIYRKKPLKILIPAFILIIMLIAVPVLIAVFTNKNKKNDISIDKYNNISYDISEGQFKNINVKVIDGKLVAEVKVKITACPTNIETIMMNFRIAEEIVKAPESDDFEEIMYWAVANMESGSESKVMSFDIDTKMIKDIRKGKIQTSEYSNRVSNLYIFPAMREGIDEF